MAKEKSIDVGEFQAQCLRLMDEVDRSGLNLIITNQGKPVGSRLIKPANNYLRKLSHS